MSNSLKARLKAGEIGLNAWSVLPSTYVAEALARTGWDSVTIDLQHGLHDYASMAACIQAMQATPITPLARTPWNEPGVIGRVLDAGAWGLICPMINTAADARALADACFYPPLGRRSNGPIRAGGYGGQASYQSIANGEVLILPQVETLEAVTNIEAILDTPGLSGIYVGPSDLGFSMGLAPKLDREEPEILRIYEGLIEQTARRGLVAGIHNLTPAYAARMANMGFTFLTAANDLDLLTQGGRAAWRATREAAGERAAP